MSKSAQRKHSFQRLGMVDAIDGRPQRFKKHPFLGAYRSGYVPMRRALRVHKREKASA